MSSHHFVKEDQEPALLILNAGGIPFAKIQELLEWSPTVIVSEESLPHVITWGIKIDVVLCTQASEERLHKELLDQAPIKIISFSDKEKLLSAACNFLKASKCKAVNILIAEMKQLDSLSSFVSMDVEVFCNSRRWVYIQSGSFEKWMPQGTQLYTYPDLQKEKLSTTGLNSDLICLQDGRIKIESNDNFWAGENLDPS